MAALEEAGIDPAGFGSFVNNPEALRSAGIELPPRFDEEAAIPVLIEWLPRVDLPRTKESIAGHLRNKAARPAAARPLLEELRSTPPDQIDLRWAIADSLVYVAPREMFDELLKVAADTSFGKSRQPIVGDLLWRIKTERATELLLELCTDEQVALHAMSSLHRKLGAETARAHIAPLADHPSAKVSAAAKRQLRKIDAAIARRAAKGG